VGRVVTLIRERERDTINRGKKIRSELITKETDHCKENYNKASGQVRENRPSEETYRVAGSKEDSENFETGDTGAAIG
jgi:predicted GNAT family N-acyltransferase